MHTSEAQEIDNIIIGGGLAGLYCAWRLQQKNQQFLLLEAEQALGGRIQAANADMPIDTGATWFWPHQHAIQTLINELNLEMMEQYTQGDTLFQQPDGSVQTMSYQQGLSYKIKGGAAELIKQLSGVIDSQKLRCDSPVTAINKRQSGWEISSQQKPGSMRYHSKNLFIAVTPRMVIQYLTPENWLSDRAISHLATQQTWMSAQAKYVAVFDKTSLQNSWRDRGYSGFAISHRGPLVEIHDASTGTQHSALFGFIGIPASQRQNIGTQQLKLACRKQICEIFDLPVPEKDFIQDWAQKKYVASQHDLAESPRHSNANLQMLRAESDVTGCYFVASEYSQNEPGYMEGAIEAVNEALSKFSS